MRYSCRAIIGHGQACEPNYQCDACAAKQKYIPRIEKLEADLETATMKRLLDSDRIQRMEAALDDALQYVSRADWHYLKDETRKALEGKDGPAG